jgi:hypothetical protein
MEGSETEAKPVDWETTELFFRCSRRCVDDHDRCSRGSRSTSRDRQSAGHWKPLVQCCRGRDSADELDLIAAALRRHSASAY